MKSTLPVLSFVMVAVVLLQCLCKRRNVKHEFIFDAQYKSQYKYKYIDKSILKTLHKRVIMTREICG